MKKKAKKKTTKKKPAKKAITTFGVPRKLLASRGIATWTGTDIESRADRRHRWDSYFQTAMVIVANLKGDLPTADFMARATKLANAAMEQADREFEETVDPHGIKEYFDLPAQVLSEVEACVERYRESHNGTDPPTKVVVHEVSRKKQLVLACLQRLEEEGKYSGHQRKPRRRREKH